MAINDNITKTSKMLNDENFDSYARREALREIVASTEPPEELPEEREKARQAAYQLLEKYTGIMGHVLTYKLSKTPEEKRIANLKGLNHETVEDLLDYTDHVFHVAAMLLVAAYSGYDEIE